MQQRSNANNSKRPLAPEPALTTCFVHLVGQPLHIAQPLTKQLIAIDREFRDAKPHVARLLRRLLESVEYIEDLTGTSENSALRSIRFEAIGLLGPRRLL